MVGTDSRPAATLPSQSSKKFGPYLRLVKVTLTTWILVGLFIGWSLLERENLYTSHTLSALVLSLIASASILYAAAALDDIQGFRDGTDRATYTASDATGLRPISDKPLVEGSISMRQAMVLTIGLIVLGLTAFWVAVIFVFEADATWLVPVVLVWAAASVQYSFGLKISYIGGQEALLILGGTGLVLLFYAALTGEVAAPAAVQGVVFGAWFAQIAVFSNTHDAEADRAAGRRNLATLTTSRGNQRGIAVMFAASSALLVVGAVAGWLPAITLVLLMPLFWHQWQQLKHGLMQQNPLGARRHGFMAVKYGGVALVAGNLINHMF